MQIRTLFLTLTAPREAVFNFLADVENFPKWAGGYCEKIELRRHGWLAYTTQGEMIVESDADDRTGVIDLRIGPSAKELELFSMRALSLGTGKTLASFAFVQSPQLKDERYERQYQALLAGMSCLIRRFGGQDVPARGSALQLPVPGLN